jgi:hypothetical protein
MKILVTGGNSRLATALKKYIEGDFFGRDKLDLSNKDHIDRLGTYDCVIHTAARTSSMNENLEILFLKTHAKKIFLFTSKQGTFLNWRQPGNMEYGLEKLTMNFIVYRHNMETHNAQLIEPGQMDDEQQYDRIAKKFADTYADWQFTKNMIYDMDVDRYIGF